MQFVLSLFELKEMLADAAELGAARVEANRAPESDRMSQREAFAAFGRSRVLAWWKRGLVDRTRESNADNGKIAYSRAELLAVQHSERLQATLYAPKFNSHGK